MSLELTNVAVFASNGNKVNIGFGTATFNEGLQVRFNIRKSHAGSEFVSWPQSSYEKDGKKVYTNEVTLLKEISDGINDQIISEFNKVLAIGPTTTPKTDTKIPDVDNSAPNTAVVTPTKKKKTVKTNW